MPYISRRAPKDNILSRILSYIFFNIILTISPILINLYIASTNDLPTKNAISYCPDICFMIIVTCSTSIRDVIPNRILTRDSLITGGAIIINIVFIVLSMITYANIAKDMLSNPDSIDIKFQQFIASLVIYILSIIIGIGIQIGGGINE